MAHHDPVDERLAFGVPPGCVEDVHQYPLHHPSMAWTSTGGRGAVVRGRGGRGAKNMERTREGDKARERGEKRERAREGR